MISAAATTSSSRQPLVVPTSMNSMKRSTCPLPRKCSAIGRTDWSLQPRLTTMLTFTGSPAPAAAAMASSTPVTGKAASFSAMNTTIIQGVLADRDAAQARVREQPGLAGEQRPVRRQGDVLNAVDPGQHRDQPLQVAAQQRLAAGQAQLAHPEAREHPPEPRQLLEGEQILAGQECEVTAEYLA